MTDDEDIRDPEVPDWAVRAAAALTGGIVVAALLLAVLSLLEPDTGRQGTPDFADVRGAVCGAVLAVGVIGLALLAARRRWVWPSWTTISLTIAGGVLAAVIVSAYAGMFQKDHFNGRSLSYAVAAFWLLVVALPALASCCRALETRGPAPAQSIVRRWATVLPVIVPAGLVVLLTVPWSLTAPWSQTGPWIQTGPPGPDRVELTVIKGDVHAAEGALPQRIGTRWTAVPLPRRSDEDRQMGAPHQVGTGFLTTDLQFINADSGTLRWQVDVPPSHEVEVFVLASQGLVVVADIDERDEPDGPLAIAVDAETGDVRWRSHTPPTIGHDGREMVQIVDRDLLTRLSGDDRTLELISTDDGSVQWRYDVGTDCAISAVETRPRLEATVTCVSRAGRTASVMTFDARSGRVLSTRAKTDDYEPEPECDARECLVSDMTDDFQVRTRLVSTVDPRRSRPLSTTTRWPSNPVWLPEQVLWTQHADPPDDDAVLPREAGTGLVIVDRSTGKVTMMPGLEGTLMVFPGAVVLMTDSELLRFSAVRS